MQNTKHEIRLADGSLYKDEGCWDKMYDHIMGAQKFIYICGYGINCTHVLLVHVSFVVR